jgi:hypothetical protein
MNMSAPSSGSKNKARKNKHEAFSRQSILTDHIALYPTR